MTWALVISMCFRFCTPQYVMLYESRQVCEDRAKEMKMDARCVPIASEGAKK